MGTTPLALQNLVDITVTVAPAAATPNTFNQGLIIGPSTTIPSYGTNPRLRQYANLQAVASDGFSTSSPEYLAAQLYFSQTQPANFLWIGRQDLTAIQTAVPHAGAAGTGYAIGDVVTVVESGASHGQLTVTAVGSNGSVTTLATIIGGQGTGYTVTNALTTTGGSGSGLQVDITAIGESYLQAAEACRAANSQWYGLMVCSPTLADNLALSEWADPLWQTTRYYPWTNDAGVANGTANNVALQLQTLKIKVLGIYATTQNGLYPNNIYAAAAVMGVEMGLQTGLAGSFFTMAHKTLVGVAAEPLTQTQYNNIKNASWNVYANFAPFQVLEPGFMSSGDPSYWWLYIAMLCNNLQINAMNVLTGNPAVAQTNAGQHLLLDACNTACAYLASIGFLAGGTWEEASIPIPSAQNPGLTTGQALPLGYLNLSASYTTQSKAARAAGSAMPVYTAITTAGAVQNLLIGVYSQL